MPMTRYIFLLGPILMEYLGGIPSHCEAKAPPETGLVRCYTKRGCVDVKSTLDPAKVACADKVGATYNFAYHHWDGTPAIMTSWRKCMGLPPYTGPDAQRLDCGKQSGAVYNPKTWHFEGTPDAMASFRECMGF